MRYEPIFDNQNKTCAEKFQIGVNKHGQGQDICKNRCSSVVNCKYYFFSRNWCVLYSACDPTRIPKHSGTTFNKTKSQGKVTVLSSL